MAQQQWDEQLTELCEQRWHRLVARARMLESDLHAAEDLVQNALVATFSKRRGFTNIGQAEQYVRRAIVTQFIDGQRRTSRESARARKVHADATRVAPDPIAEVDGTMHAMTVLHQLPPRVRACIALRFLEDRSIAETAALLSLSEGAVKRYVSDGLGILNQMLGTSESAEDDLVSISLQDGARP